MSRGKPEGETWRILQPPTGTGKTQGLCVYAAMLAEQNEKLKSFYGFALLSHTGLQSHKLR